MDINQVLDNFATREALIQFIRELPDEAVGIMMFRYDHPEKKINENGDELEMNVFKFYGRSTSGEALWMLHNFIDYVRS